MSTAQAPSPSRRDHSAYRSATPGAKLRRRELLRRRRDEFADLPDGMRSVYVARVARATAGLMATLGGALLVGASASPALAGWLEQFTPGPQPAVMATLLVSVWIGGCLSYLAGWALAERRFTRAMLRAVKPTDDLHHDVERLSHVTPGAVASGMTLAWETASSALPVLAFATIVPATAIYLAMAAAIGGYVEPSAFETALFAASDWLAAFAGLGTVAALWCLRLRRARRQQLSVQRALAWALVAAGIVAGIAALSFEWQLTAALAGSTAFISALVGWATNRVRKDRLVIDCQDGDTGASPSVSAALRSARDWFAGLRQLVGERGLRGALSHTVRAARGRLALGRRTGALLKAPLSWSFATTASVAAAALIIALTAQFGSNSLSRANDAEPVPHARSTPAGVPWNPGPNTARPVVDNNNDSSTAVLYTAPPTGSARLGTLLVLDLSNGVFARTDIELDLDKLPCGDVPANATWDQGTLARSAEQIALKPRGGDITELEITSYGTTAPMELRSYDGTVFTPCMVAHDVSMRALADAAELPFE